MADPWPATLPQVVLSQPFAEQVGDGRIRHQPDVGPAIIRRRSTAMSGRMSCAIVVSDAQWDDLLEFGADTLLGWSLPFTFPNPADGVSILVRFGEDLPSRRELVPGSWEVSFTLDVLP
jgi:hypothetical protein